jgi:hypothetical protein
MYQNILTRSEALDYMQKGCILQIAPHLSPAVLYVKNGSLEKWIGTVRRDTFKRLVERDSIRLVEAGDGFETYAYPYSKEEL